MCIIIYILYYLCLCTYVSYLLLLFVSRTGYEKRHPSGRHEELWAIGEVVGHGRKERLSKENGSRQEGHFGQREGPERRHLSE